MKLISRMQVKVLVYAVALAAAWSVGRALAAAPEFRVESGQRQLLLDDAGIEKIGNLTRTLHQPVKKGAVIRPSPPGKTFLQTRSAPAWDPQAKVWKLWPVVGGVYSGTSYVESRDGIHRTKPVTSQVEVNGSRQNNYITVDESLGWPANAIMNVVMDPDDPDPARRFKGLGHAFKREPVISADGINWKKLDVPSIKSKDESNLSYHPVTRTFIATVKTSGRFGQSQSLTTSKDFGSWTQPKLVFQADELDQALGHERIRTRFADPTLKPPEFNIPQKYGVDVYNFGVFRYESLDIGMPTMFHKTGRVSKDRPGFDDLDLPEKILTEVRKYGDWTGFHQVQLACSRDLKNWCRAANRRPFIDASPMDGGSYDLQGLSPPSQAVLRAHELCFYYTGGQSYAIISSGTPNSGGAVCLAVLRRDGFISLDAGQMNGFVLTPPFKLTGPKLSLNVNAFKGELHVEVLNEEAGVVAKSRPITGDLMSEAVRRAQGDLAKLAGAKVSLRFTLHNGKLYSWWLDPDSS